ncbi:MAG: sensor histidine kinase [Planctomycetota bacterium]
MRRRLMLVLAAGFAVLIAGAGIFVESLLGERVTGEFDAALLAKARALVALTEQEDGQIELDYEPQFMPEFERSDRPDYFQIWLDDGTALHRSARLGREDLPHTASLATQPALRDAPLPDGRPGRLVQLAFVPKSPDETDAPTVPTVPAKIDPSSGTRALVLVVARGRGRLDRLLGMMRLAIFGVGGIAIVLGGVLVWQALVAGFRPLDAIAAQVKALDADSLSSRIRLTRIPRELAPIVDQLNALLGRLEASFERERRFAGNVAHELRTPIAELRSLADVGAKWPEDEASVVRFFDDVRDIAGRMEGLVADLLLLARCEAGVEKVVSTPTDLEEIITSTWSRLAPRASHTGLRFHLDLPEGLGVKSDPGKLAIVFANVLGNAVTYARPDSEIRCVGAQNGARFRLDITNPAPPLSAADLERLAEPFWRKDEARSSAEHAGLGLSVVSALAMLLGLEVGFDQDRNGTFRVRLEGRALAES